MDVTSSPSPKRAKIEPSSPKVGNDVSASVLSRPVLPRPVSQQASSEAVQTENPSQTTDLSPILESKNTQTENQPIPVVSQTLDSSESAQNLSQAKTADSNPKDEIISSTTANDGSLAHNAPIKILDEPEEIQTAPSGPNRAPTPELVPSLPVLDNASTSENTTASAPASVPVPPPGQNGQNSGISSPSHFSPAPSAQVTSIPTSAPPVSSSSFPRTSVAVKPEVISVKSDVPKVEPDKPKSRLVVLAGKCLQHHILDHLRSLRLIPNVPTIEVSADRLSTFPFKEYSYINFCIEYDETFIDSLDKIKQFCESERTIFSKVDEIAYHFIFEKGKKWADYTEAEKASYTGFLECLNRIAGDKVTQCSLVNKYDISTVYITEKDDLARLGQEIQADCALWKNLKVFDYGDNCIRFLPGVKFSDSVQVINIGGGSSLETLAGFKMPAQLKVLVACKGLIPSIDYVAFPQTLERLDLSDNRIFFLNYIEFPVHLRALDLSRNRIDSLKNVVFPRGLEFLSVSHNPIECIKGVRFPESIEYLDISCIPNESMTGIKFPDATLYLNLQQSMTNTRGLKLPPFVKELNLACDGVNSINPLRLPNSIEKLFLANNNIKTLNKVAFPSALRELYLGNNMITTLKNVQFPSSLEVLDLEMDPHNEENEKYVTSLKDVVFPPNLRVLKLGYHSIKTIESMEFPFHLQELSLAYNDLKVFRNVRFGPKLRVLDLSGNQELMSVDSVMLPESLVEFKIPSLLLNNLPESVVERANKHELTLTKSLPYTV